jgi:hypothetical protein
MATTLLTHIYNEAYLLPFWLNHHKDMFDHGIIVDYRSTDNSVNICKEICPTWDVVTTRNAFFGAREVDQEMMEIENGLEGIKVVLNTTEFLFCETSIKDVFSKFAEPTALAVKVACPFSLASYDPASNKELFQNLLNDDVRYHQYRGVRFIHSFKHGNYVIGRHASGNPSKEEPTMHVVWFGYYPLNEKLLARKLQIKKNMPAEDIQHGFGHQHLLERSQMLQENASRAATGLPLSHFSRSLHRLITNYN